MAWEVLQAATCGAWGHHDASFAASGSAIDAKHVFDAQAPETVIAVVVTLVI